MTKTKKLKIEFIVFHEEDTADALQAAIAYGNKGKYVEQYYPSDDEITWEEEAVFLVIANRKFTRKELKEAWKEYKKENDYLFPTE